MSISSTTAEHDRGERCAKAVLQADTSGFQIGPERRGPAGSQSGRRHDAALVSSAQRKVTTWTPRLLTVMALAVTLHARTVTVFAATTLNGAKTTPDGTATLPV